MARLADYAAMLTHLLPQGLSFQGESHKKLIDGLAQELARFDERAVTSREEFFPDTTQELLPEWARILGVSNVLLDRESRSLVLGKFASAGGHSQSAYRALIKTVATSAVTFSDFNQARVGTHVGFKCYGPDWEDVWEIGNIKPSEASAVKAVIDQAAQAHTHVRFVTTEGRLV